MFKFLGIGTFTPKPRQGLLVMNQGDALKRASPPHSVQKPMKPPAISCKGYPSAFAVTSLLGDEGGFNFLEVRELKLVKVVGKVPVFGIIGSNQNTNKDHIKIM